MNNKEKLSILTAAIDRAYTAIAETSGAEMKDERLRDLMFNIERMEIEAARLNVVESTEPAQPDMTSCVSSDTGTPKEPLAVEAAEPEQTPAEAEEQETKKPAMTRDEMKAVLLEVRKKGVNVPALLRQFGADSITALTEDKFDDVMRTIEQELANAS